MLPGVFAMQKDAVASRYQPALAELPIVPDMAAEWLQTLPVEQFLLCIGVPELAFGMCMLLSLTAIGDSLASQADHFASAMRLWMVGPLTAHLLGDDFTLPLDSNVGPTGFVPAAVVLVLLCLRVSLQSAPAPGKVKGS